MSDEKRTHESSMGHEALPFSGLIKDTESNFASRINQMVMEDMHDYPELGHYVVDKMDSSLTTSERALIGETALVIYKIVNSFPTSNSGEKTDESVDLKTWIMVTEDDDPPNEKDPNEIYLKIQKGMSEYPELSTYVAARMRESVSLKEANLVGETALIVYKSLKDYPGRKKE